MGASTGMMCASWFACQTWAIRAGHETETYLELEEKEVADADLVARVPDDDEDEEDDGYEVAHRGDVDCVPAVRHCE